MSGAPILSGGSRIAEPEPEPCGQTILRTSFGRRALNFNSRKVVVMYGVDRDQSGALFIGPNPVARLARLQAQTASLTRRHAAMISSKLEKIGEDDA